MNYVFMPMYVGAAFLVLAIGSLLIYAFLYDREFVGTVSCISFGLVAACLIIFAITFFATTHADYYLISNKDLTCEMMMETNDSHMRRVECVKSVNFGEYYLNKVVVSARWKDEGKMDNFMEEKGYSKSLKRILENNPNKIEYCGHYVTDQNSYWIEDQFVCD